MNNKLQPAHSASLRGVSRLKRRGAQRGKRNRLALSVFAMASASALLGCAVDATEWADDSWTGDPQALESSTFEEFQAATRTELAGREVFIVESDLVIEGEEELRRYYDSQFGGDSEKAIINLTREETFDAPVADIRVDSDRSTTVLDISYCFDDSRWGGLEVNDSDQDGILNERLPSKSAVLAALQFGARAWEGAANLKFNYLKSADGAGCAAAADIFVTINERSSGTATGPFPSRSVQALTIPVGGLSNLLAVHELGHALGFRHEHIHSADPNGCSEGDSQWEDYLELFDQVDTDSAMIYRNCRSGSQAISGNTVSRMDGIGARMYYGNPEWWSAVIL